MRRQTCASDSGALSLEFLQMAKKDVHVSRQPGGSGWKVTQGSEKLSAHRTQQNAVDRGRAEAKRDGVDLVTHARDGKIRSKDSFGHDPLPPKDTEH
jgi:hypothetical protein